MVRDPGVGGASKGRGAGEVGDYREGKKAHIVQKDEEEVRERGERRGRRQTRREEVKGTKGGRTCLRSKQRRK